MITASFIALALFLGYAVTVGLSMAATFGITAASRDFVAKDYRIKTGYKYAQDGVWLVSAATGGYVTALVNGPSHSWLVGAALVAILVTVLRRSECVGDAAARAGASDFAERWGCGWVSHRLLLHLR